ncbi:FAD-dependent thymidylate synthase [Candidatus Kaiserbacteria bacterium]|nr:FAD-dependent thymidylate synthase [Candidatus Kaiserbacteria bacterium]
MDTRILELKHATRDLPGGGFVLVLNTGAVITPEAEAMLQALHSRSVGGIREHLKTLAEKGPEKFMQSFYVGYGHKSIGDCGTGTIFIEGVSMLVAKAIQDWLLYSGQEASTRYIDFSTQKFVDPIGSSDSAFVLEEWRKFYLAAQEPVRIHLRECFPRNKGEDEKAYEKAINARSFDILRGFLPAGASTNLSWHSNLRQAADHLALLRHHSLKEVREVADAMGEALKEAYPSSFGHKRYEDTEAYDQFWMESKYYFLGERFPNGTPLIAASRGPWITRDTIDKTLLESEYRRFLEKRPPKTELPKQMAEAGTMQFEFLLDFGSFRDIQRQRSVIQRMPLINPRFGMHPWYFDSLPKEAAVVARGLVQRQLDLIAGFWSEAPLVGKFKCSREILQYYYPMGMCVPCRLTGDLPALVYVTELRAQAVVHPTLHEVALVIADELLERFGYLGLKLYVDREKGRFDVKRGLQDITRKD